MSSEILLVAGQIGKVYTGALHPMATLKKALFGINVKAAESFPVLEGINLEIRKGETVGIMGRNGAGKTTLLGILGNVIEPTSGVVTRRGKIATLLGLSTGFNLNFSGRENAHVFCSIQGMTRSDATLRMPEIEEFADIGKYFDMPIRTYSSGMHARLAFSCAVHVNADLIIIDETLAVGDAMFKMKCYDRIKRMKESGQTFLLVSHNQNIVANFCTRAIVIDEGRKVFDGPTIKAVEVYKEIRSVLEKERSHQARTSKNRISKKLGRAYELNDFKYTVTHADELEIGVINAELSAYQDVEHPVISFGLRNHHGIVLCVYDSNHFKKKIPPLKQGDRFPIEFRFTNYLLPGRYFFSASTHRMVGDVKETQSLHQNVLSFDIVGDTASTGIINLDMNIQIDNLKTLTSIDDTKKI